MAADILSETAEIIPIMPSTHASQSAAREIIRTGTLRFNRIVRAIAIAEEAREIAEIYGRRKPVVAPAEHVSFWDAPRAVFGDLRLKLAGW
jgi:hypothetical protein